MSALEQLRESLREAARRDIEAERARTRRRRRRATGFAALALLGGAAAAGAAELISVGEPVKDTRREQADYRPAQGLTVAVTARSGRELPFAVGIYTARNGNRCALAGYARGSSLGRIEGGTFRPYGRTPLGACGAAGQTSWETLELDGRTLVYGRAKTGAREVTARVGTEAGHAPPGPGGAFLFVFDDVTPGQIPSVTAR